MTIPVRPRRPRAASLPSPQAGGFLAGCARTVARCAGATTSMGRPRRPGASFTAVTAGGRHACGLRLDGTVTCLGQQRLWAVRGARGELSRGLPAAGWHSCGAAPRRHCPPAGATTKPATSTRPRAASLRSPQAGRHFCGVRADGSVTCWGPQRSWAGPTRPGRASRTSRWVGGIPVVCAPTGV